MENKNWLIGTVTYTRDESGQHAHVGLWPREAFSVEPTTPDMYLVTQADVDGNNPTRPNADNAPPAAPFGGTPLPAGQEET